MHYLKRLIVTIAGALLAPVGAARAQVTEEGAPYGVTPSAVGQPRQPSAPVAPRAVSTPAGWVNGKAPEKQPEISAEDAVKPWRTELPEKFTGTEVIARVGTEIILASDVLPGVEETVQRAIAAGQVPETQAKNLRYQLMVQRLGPMVDTKILLIEARRAIPKENLSKIEGKVKEIYEKEQIPKLIDGKKIKSRAELIKAMRDAGTSLEEQHRQFYERSIAAQFVHKEVGDDKEITHENMLAYYREHLKTYETAPRARWEHIMVQISNYPSKAEAHAKIAAWGNELFAGTPFSEVAKKHSDDVSSEDGGMHAWTTQGSLVSEVLDQAIFTLPLNQLSPILDDGRGLHIVRVVERNGLTRKPFNEVQAEIKKKIKSERDGAAQEAYIAKLRKKVKVWTIFDELIELAEKNSDTRRQ